MEDLIVETELEGFPGAPFPEAIVKAVGEQIRSEAGWHIAPEATETLEVWADGGVTAILPTLRVVEVTAVRNADTGQEIHGWRINKATGSLHRRGGRWPEVIEVDLTHGYKTCPTELLALAAARSKQITAGGVKSEALGGHSISFELGELAESGPAVAKYRLHWRP